MSSLQDIYDEPLAQLVEHLTFNQRVEGSSPSWLTIFFYILKKKMKGDLHSYRRGVEQRALHLRINIELFRRIRIEAYLVEEETVHSIYEACAAYLHSYRRGVEQFGSSLGS